MKEQLYHNSSRGPVGHGWPMIGLGRHKWLKAHLCIDLDDGGNYERSALMNDILFLTEP